MAATWTTDDPGEDAATAVGIGASCLGTGLAVGLKGVGVGSTASVFTGAGADICGSSCLALEGWVRGTTAVSEGVADCLSGAEDWVATLPEGLEALVSGVSVDSGEAASDGTERLPCEYPKPKKTAQSRASAKKIPRMVVAPREISRSGSSELRRSRRSCSVSYRVFTVRPFSPARQRQESQSY